MRTEGRPRIALACSGLGEIARGYERAFEDLYFLLRDEANVVLFKGGSGGPGVRLPRLSRKSRVTAVLNRSSTARVEGLSFGLSLLPAVVAGRFDLLHFINHELSFYAKLPKGLLRPLLLFTNGGMFPPSAYSQNDYIHLLNPIDREEALRFGIAESRLFMIPRGVNVEKFRTIGIEERRALREKHGIPPDTFVVLSVGYLGEPSHKRMAWVIDEVADAGDDLFLVLVGGQDRTSVRHAVHGKARFGSRFKMMTLPHSQMPEAFSLADLFVLGSLKESFGIANAEAMAAGIPIVAHDAPILRWVIGDGGSFVNMTAPGKLAEEVRYYRDSPEELRRRGNRGRRRAVDQFDRDRLGGQYLEMYRRCCESAGHR